MWFLNSAGNEKRLVAVAFLLQPGNDLAYILAVLVLGVFQSTGAMAGRGLPDQLANLGWQILFPGLAIRVFLNRSMLGLKCLPRRRDPGQFIVVELICFGRLALQDRTSLMKKRFCSGVCFGSILGPGFLTREFDFSFSELVEHGFYEIPRRVTTHIPDVAFICFSLACILWT